MSEIIFLTLMVVLFALIFLGVPIGYALFTVGFLGLVGYGGFDLARSLLYNTIYSQSQVYTFSTVPMFILMAVFLNEAKILDDVFSAMDDWTRGVLPGGLAVGTTVANGVFAALSGSSTAASAAIAKIAKPELESYDYSEEITMGTIAASGTFAMMFPPSLGLIIYGLITETSIGRLFMAGIIPGILTLVFYIGVILIWSTLDPSAVGAKETQKKAPWSNRIRSAYHIWPAGALIFLVLGGIYAGVVTPTESGALGAAGALLIGLILYHLDGNGIRNALAETANITVYVFIIIIGAKYFGRYVAFEGIVSLMINTLSDLPFGDFGILLIVLALYLVLGMFLNQLPILVLTLPLTYPLAVDGLGFSPVWFGIIIIKTVEIGMITPPIGINVYVSSNAVNVDPTTTFRGAARFIAADLLVLGGLIAFPTIATYVPDSMM